MNHRQKLEDLQNEIASTSATKLSAGLRDRWASAIYTILADWPEDAKVVPREANDNMQMAAIKEFDAFGSKFVWRVMFDAYNPDDD